MKINKKTNKKGFTIVELVIVIAVIAILAAVLIPTFSSLVKTAQTSSDISLVKNLNTSLTTSEILDGKNETMTDALNDVKEDGYDVTKLTPTNSDNDILWHEESNRFVLRIKDKYESCGSGVVVDASKLYKLWKIYNEVKELESDPVYSIYWNVDADLPEDTELSVGFDAGTTKNVSNIVYKNAGVAKEVVIRTNGVETSLTVNGYVDPSDSSKGDVIKHYGAAGSVDIISVANASYHEYGKVAFMEIAKGRAALESGSQVTQIHISTQVTAVADDGTKTKTANTFDSITIALANDIEAPEFSRDAVSEIAEGGTLVVALQEGTADANASKDYVWLYQQGVIQQMVVTTTSAFDANSKATDYEESSNTYQVADDIANNFTGSNTWENVTKDENGNITDANVTSDSGLSESVKAFEKMQAIHEATVAEAIENYPGDYWIDVHANSFAGGTGTQEDPYLVSTPMELALIAYNVNNNIDNGSYAGAYYKLTSNIDLGSKAWTGIGTWRYPFHGSIDGDAGNGNIYEIKNMHDGGASTWASAFTAYTARTYGNPYGFIGIAGSNTTGSNLTVSNLKFTNATLEVQQGLCVGTIVGYAPHTDDFGKSYTSILYQNHYITDACKQANQGDPDYYKNSYKYIYYFAEENIWFRYPTYKVENIYYQGYVGEEGYGNKALNDITITNVSVEGTLSGLDCIGGLVGKAYNTGSVQIDGCSVNANITATGGRAAGLVGYASYLTDNGKMNISNNTIQGNLSSSNTSQSSNTYATCGVAPDYLAGSRDNKFTADPNNAEYVQNYVTSSGNSYTGEIYYNGEKKN